MSDQCDLISDYLGLLIAQLSGAHVALSGHGMFSQLIDDFLLVELQNGRFSGNAGRHLHSPLKSEIWGQDMKVQVFTHTKNH